MKLYSNVAKKEKNPKSGEVTASVKKTERYTGTGDYMHRDAPDSGYSGPTKGDFSGNASPRVGGTASKSSVGPLKGANKKTIKVAKTMIRPGTGSGAKKKPKF